MKKLTFRSSVPGALLAGAMLWLGPLDAAAETISIAGHPADYEAQRQQVVGSPASVAAVRGSAEELRVFAQDTGGFLFEEGRPIFQFDLSVLEQSALSAVLTLELVSVSANGPFAVEVWGVDANRSGPLAFDDAGAGGQFAAAGYERASGSAGALADEASAAGSLSQDITVYLNDRYAEFEDGGDSWIYMRLQSSTNFSPGAGIDATFSFASVDHSVEQARPRLEVVPIPEPRHAAFLLVCFTAAVFAARRASRGAE